jgi:hypothetical protein
MDGSKRVQGAGRGRAVGCWLAVGGWLAVGCWLAIGCGKGGGEGARACPPDRTRDFLALDDRYAVEAAGHLCDYPDGLAALFREIEASPPDLRMISVLRALAEEPSLLARICGADGPAVFAGMAQGAREQASAHLVDGCRLERLGLAPREALAAAEPDRLIVAALVFTWMTSAGVPERQAREAGRKILGR